MFAMCTALHNLACRSSLGGISLAIRVVKIGLQLHFIGRAELQSTANLLILQVASALSLTADAILVWHLPLSPHAWCGEW